MANATSIVLSALTANGELATPTAQALDTGTAAVTLESAATSEMDRIILRVENTAAANLGVSIDAGESPPSWRKSLGAFTATALAQNDEAWFGPFESARFAQADGKLKVTFTLASGTITGNFTAYRLPKV